MLVEVKVPVLSESVSSATLVAWRKKQGDYVERDENMIDIETDKVVLELPAPQSGMLVTILKGDGEWIQALVGGDLARRRHDHLRRGGGCRSAVRSLPGGRGG